MEKYKFIINNGILMIYICVVIYYIYQLKKRMKKDREMFEELTKSFRKISHELKIAEIKKEIEMINDEVFEQNEKNSRT